MSTKKERKEEVTTTENSSSSATMAMIIRVLLLGFTLKENNKIEIKDGFPNI